MADLMIPELHAFEDDDFEDGAFEARAFEDDDLEARVLGVSSVSLNWRTRPIWMERIAIILFSFYCRAILLSSQFR